MTASRRGFLKGALGTFGIAGWPVLAMPPGWKHSGTPNLRFGVISDTHMMVNYAGNAMQASHSAYHFTNALKYLREANVDAIVHCGDMANAGNVDELQAHADVWFKVFPKNKGKGGKIIARLFVTGNHDMEAKMYEQRRQKVWPDAKERAKHVLANDIAKHWERMWKEQYEPVWHREVKGYHFFGRNWGVREEELANLVDKLGDKYSLKVGDKPFFCISHDRHHSNANSRILTWRNPFLFFGHWHKSATDWRFCKLYDRVPGVQVPPCTAPDWPLPLTDGNLAGLGEPGGKASAGIGRQGFIVNMYDDMMVIERHEFSHGGKLGVDWVVPFAQREPHPFSNEEMVKLIGNPQFRKDAKLTVRYATIPSPEDAKAKVPAVRISIPPADGEPSSRVYAYYISVAGEEESHRVIYAAGCNMGIDHVPDKGVTTLDIPVAELPSGETFTLNVTPYTSLGTSGAPLSTTFAKAKSGQSKLV